MKSNILCALTLSSTLSMGTTPYQRQNNTKEEISLLFTENTKPTEDGPKKLSISQKKGHKEKHSPNTKFISISSSDLKGSPFDPSHPMISLNATNLLWASQSEKILSEFNTHDQKLTFEEKLQKGIKVPLIYPELSKYFPKNLIKVQQDPQFSNYSFSNPNTLILLKTKSGRNALAYYQNGTLAMTSFVSIGTLRHKTISGQYPITPDQIRRRSRKYKNAPMPYSLHVSGGYFIHQWKSNGYPLSHGCIRVPWLYQQWLYKQIKQGKQTQIIIHNPYQATSFKKGE